MRNAFRKKRSVITGILLLAMVFVFAVGQIAFAEETAPTRLFSDDYELYKGNTGESGTGPEFGTVAVSGKTPEDVRNRSIGVVTGATTAQLLQEYYDDEIELCYFDSTPDLIQALKANKIDAYITDNIGFLHQYETDSSLSIVYPYLDTFCIKAFFPKSGDEASSLKEEYNSFLAELRENNALEEIFLTYLNGDPEPLDRNVSGERGSISVAVDSAFGKPFCYYDAERQMNGYELYLIAAFAKEYGYCVEFADFSFAGMLAAVSSGKCDMGASATQSTYEREETIDFSDAEYAIHHVLITRSDDMASGSFLASVVNSFKKTFFVEARWTMFVRGVLNTLMITILSAVFGTLLGFVLYKMSVSGRVILKKLALGLAWLVRGMPVVVLLMILYYIIFAKAHIDGIWVSVVAFSLTFAVAMMGMITTGVGAVDNGQSEGAIALGYTKKQTFRYIVFPQAVTHFMPLYRAELIALIKATAIVGYIAVQDVTKVSDIVRSRTFEAFFPLIVVAILYFVLGALLTSAVKIFSNMRTKKQRNREIILKGIRVHD